MPRGGSARGERGSVRDFSLIVFAQRESRREPRGGGGSAGAGGRRGLHDSPWAPV